MTPQHDELTVDLDIEGMTCASCVARVERRLERIDGVHAQVNLATERARVRYAPGVGRDSSRRQVVPAAALSYDSSGMRRAGLRAELWDNNALTGAPSSGFQPKPWQRVSPKAAACAGPTCSTRRSVGAAGWWG